MEAKKRAPGAGRPRIHKGGSTPIRVSNELLPVIELLQNELAHGNLITVEDLINKSQPLEWIFNISPYDLMEMIGKQIKHIQFLTDENEHLKTALVEQADQNLKMINDIRKSSDKALKESLSNLSDLTQIMDAMKSFKQ